MKIKCCGASKGRKVINSRMELKVQPVMVGKNVRKYAAEQYVITKKNIQELYSEHLEDLYNMLQDAIAIVKTEKDKRTGIATCHTSTLNDPIKINVPGVGCCSYTGD